MESLAKDGKEPLHFDRFVTQGMSKRKANTLFYEKKCPFDKMQTISHSSKSPCFFLLASCVDYDSWIKRVPNDYTVSFIHLLLRESPVHEIKKHIFWRVEWTFEGTDVQLIDQRVDENLSLETVLAKHLTNDGGDVMVKHRLRNFCWKPLNEFKLLLPLEPCSATEKAFHELNVKKTPHDQLANKPLIEYLVIKVVLPRDVGKYIITTDQKLIAKAVNEEQPAGPIMPILHEPKGVPLREEEIEEGEFLL